MNPHEAEKLESLATHLPQPVQGKILRLIDEAAAANVALNAANEQAREANAAWRQYEHDVSRSHTFTTVTGPVEKQRGVFTTETNDDGRPVYESRDEYWIKNTAPRLVAKWSAWQRAKVNIPYLQSKWQGYAFLFGLIDWLPANKHHTKHVPVKAKGGDHAAALEKLRGQIAELDDRYAGVELAPCAVEDLIARADMEVDRLAELGSIRLDARIREGSPVNLDWPELAFNRPDSGIQPEKLVWLFASEIKEKLATKIRAETPAVTMTDFDRAAEMSALEADKLALERQEEAHIVAAAELGQFIARRRDASPLAILEVE